MTFDQISNLNSTFVQGSNWLVGEVAIDPFIIIFFYFYLFFCNLTLFQIWTFCLSLWPQITFDQNFKL